MYSVILDLPMKCLGLVALYAVSNPDPVSFTLGVIASIYFLSQIFFNVVKRHYKGSWRAFAKDIYLGFKNRIWKKNKDA